MAKTAVCKVDDLKIGEKKTFKIGGKDILVFHLKDGFFGTQNLCPHTLAPLRLGKIEQGCVIRCPLHHARFDIKSGAVKNWANFPPGIQVLNVIRGEKPLKTYKVEVQGNEVFVIYNGPGGNSP